MIPAVFVRRASGNYFVYHLEITSDYYKQRPVDGRGQTDGRVGLEEFIIALCQSVSADHDVDICSEIATTRFLVKDFLQFPLDHEQQHVRSIRQLQYVDPRDVVVDADACSICLCEWAELDRKQLVLSLLAATCFTTIA
ncbi:hypothetical protein PsorP6_007996 [Peronosclerospora sorghi]|uniref:Uncharacterized protein n=1 Tax=Peronosclerospora sorghi TaxID=230839 RepID=A0ACC0WD99_9STRA|nr:hypothetical protein PsorP6_007996 [Peronosclerospora sorghi]